MNEILVSVCIPVRNGSRYIGEAITSILNQSYKNLEVLIFDNNSTDTTSRIVKTFIDKDQRVKYIKNEFDIGMFENFNKCFDHCEGSYFSILCHDDYYSNLDAIKIALEALQKNPNLIVAYSNMYYVDSKGRVLRRSNFKKNGVYNILQIGIKSIEKTRNLFSIPLLIKNTENLNIRYDPTFKYAADIDLAIQLSKHGHSYWLEQPLISNRYHKDNATRKLMTRNIPEIIGIAQKHYIHLSKTKRTIIYLRGSFWILAKRFFLFINK